MRKTKQRGITLVALVITIIILLILAGISISVLTNQGLFAQAEEAKKRTENAQEKEQAYLEKFNNAINNIINKNENDIKYMITYNYAEGAAGNSAPTIATYNTTVVIDNPTKEGYVFTGWTISGMDNCTHIYGNSTSTQNILNNITETSFKNLRSTMGTVTFTANWEKAKTYLFNAGDEYELLTGKYMYAVYDDTGAGADYGNRGEYLEVTSKVNAKKTYGCSAVCTFTKEVIDVTNYNEIIFHVRYRLNKSSSTQSNYFAQFYFGLEKTQPASSWYGWFQGTGYEAVESRKLEWDTKYVTEYYEDEISLDISNISGSFYVCVTSQADATCLIDSISLK